jgi:cytochrome o ubiquinol oxidase subunit 1
VTTILKMRAPGMSYLRMPMFCWTALGSNMLIVATLPILTATLAMLTFDRYIGFHFFTNGAGGNPMMFMNLIWASGHLGLGTSRGVYPDPAGVWRLFRDILDLLGQAAVRLSLDGRGEPVHLRGFVHSLAAPFLHLGAGADVNAAFGIATSVIAVGTGVKIYNWLFTMYGGRIRFDTPMLWPLGFILNFMVGEMTGVLLAVPPADFMLHNSMFIVAHFHNVIVGGVLFGAFAGMIY